MKGIVKNVLRFEPVEQNNEGHLVVELDVELTKTVEIGEHVHLELSPVLTVRNVWLDQLDGENQYRIIIDKDEHERMSDTRCSLDECVYAMVVADKIPSVAEMVQVITDRLREAVPAQHSVETEVMGANLSVTINNEANMIPIRVLYEDWLLAGGLKFFWNDQEKLRANFNYPDVEQAMLWMTEHNSVLKRQVIENPTIAACALVNRGTNEHNRLSYVYMIAMMNGGYVEMPIRETQVIAMIRSGRQPRADLTVDEQTGEAALNVYEEDILPQAILDIENVSSDVLALTYYL